MDDEQMTWIQWVQKLAAEIGVECSDDEADLILWEYTPFPMAGTSYCEAGARAYLTAKKSETLREWCEQQERDRDDAMRRASACCWKANL